MTPPADAPAPRRTQQRATDTRTSVLAAALSEFAERGYEAASIRRIAAGCGVQHPLITHHFRTKDILWRAVAEHAFAEISGMWDDAVPSDPDPCLSPIERLRAYYAAFLCFTMTRPDFHHFMLRESHPANPRLAWLAATILRPMMDRVMPVIRAAQAAGDLPCGEPALIHYMLIGMTSILSSLRDEISETAGLDAATAGVVDDYMRLMDGVVFRPKHRA